MKLHVFFNIMFWMFLFNSSFSTDINGPLDIHKQRLERLVRRSSSQVKAATIPPIRVQLCCSEMLDNGEEWS